LVNKYNIGMRLDIGN